MNKHTLQTIALSCILCILSVVGKAQTNLPSIGTVYNYNVGDTFRYKITDLNLNQIVMYVNRVVLSRDNSHYPDSLVYSIEETFLDTNELNPAVWDTARKVFYNCNDTIFPYNGFISCQEATDSCSAVSSIIITADSLFPGLTVYHADFGCGWWNSGWNNAAEGFGIVHAYNGCGDFVLQQYDIVMVHYYKAPAGVQQILDGSGIMLYPNPASNTLIIESERTINNGQLKIINTQGQLVNQWAISNKQLEIDISQLKQGIYFFSLFDGKKEIKRKLIKE